MLHVINDNFAEGVWQLFHSQTFTLDIKGSRLANDHLYAACTYNVTQGSTADSIYSNIAVTLIEDEVGIQTKSIKTRYDGTTA